MNQATDITPAIQQRLAWDIVPCEEVQDIWRYLDLIPPSEDVAEVAHAESHNRLDTLMPIAIVGEIYITLAAEIVSKVMLKHYEDQHGEQPTDVEQSVMAAQNHEVIRGSVFPIIAHLMETGMLQLGPTACGQTGRFV
jgi:hypothetical protein